MDLDSAVTGVTSQRDAKRISSDDRSKRLWQFATAEINGNSSRPSIY